MNPAVAHMCSGIGKHLSKSEVRIVDPVTDISRKAKLKKLDDVEGK